MADIELLKPMPDPPLPTDPEEVFDEKAGETLTAEQYLVNVDLNTKLIPQMNLATAKVTADKNAAAQSAQYAAAAADRAEAVDTNVSEQVAAAQASANNAKASATAAESAQGSIGNLALIHSLTIGMMRRF